MQLILSIIITTLLLTILGKSMSVLYSTLRFFHLGHAITLTLGAYLVYTMLIIWGMPMWVSILVSLLVGVLLMLVVNRWVYDPLQNRGVEQWKMMMASLGVYVVLQNIVSLVWGSATLSFRTWPIKDGYEFLGAHLTEVQLVSIVSGLSLLLCDWLFIEKTNIGRQIEAVSTNPNLSAIQGISNKRVAYWSLAYGTCLAACVGILIAADIDMTPTMGFDWLMYGVVAMIIGGMGKMRYTIFGAFLLAAAQQLSAYFFDSKWMNATAYIILVVFLYFRPFGFSGKKLKKTEV